MGQSTTQSTGTASGSRVTWWWRRRLGRRQSLSSSLSSAPQDYLSRSLNYFRWVLVLTIASNRVKGLHYTRLSTEWARVSEGWQPDGRVLLRVGHPSGGGHGRLQCGHGAEEGLAVGARGLHPDRHLAQPPLPAQVSVSRCQVCLYIFFSFSGKFPSLAFMLWCSLTWVTRSWKSRWLFCSSFSPSASASSCCWTTNSISATWCMPSLRP